jgi:hypothetical protein
MKYAIQITMCGDIGDLHERVWTTHYSCPKNKALRHCAASQEFTAVGDRKPTLFKTLEGAEKTYLAVVEKCNELHEKLADLGINRRFYVNIIDAEQFGLVDNS